jgi:dihydropteroate synthase
VQNSSHSIEVAKSWQLRSRVLEFGSLPALMAIVNVTPDSFSDGGRFFTPQAAIDQALRLEDEGAAILDIGGESTRPYSEPVPADDELRRIVPVVEALRGRVQIPISIDTSKAQVAEAAIDLGAEIINDVTGLTGDPAMIDVAVRSGAGICAMHMQGTPQTMQDKPQYQDVVQDIAAYLQQRDEALLHAGVKAEKICLDPGIGFGKTHQHNLQLLQQCGTFHRLNRPLLVGHSRKGFIAHVIGSKERDRLFGTIGVSLSLARQKIQVIRVHDIRPIREALLLYAAAGGLD